MNEESDGWTLLLVFDLVIFIILASLLAYGLLFWRQWKRARNRRTGDTRHDGDPTIPSR